MVICGDGGCGRTVKVDILMIIKDFVIDLNHSYLFKPNPLSACEFKINTLND